MAPHILNEEDWDRLREIRLAALHESPIAFLSTYSEELTYQERKWRAEFARGEWVIEVRNNEAIALVGVTQEQDAPPDECYLEYLWVSPGFRRRGIATALVKNTLRRLLNLGFAAVRLWVLDGNESAKHFYESCGFSSTALIQRPDQDPSRSEELLRLSLHERHDRS